MVNSPQNSSKTYFLIEAWKSSNHFRKENETNSINQERVPAKRIAVENSSPKKNNVAEIMAKYAVMPQSRKIVDFLDTPNLKIRCDK